MENEKIFEFMEKMYSEMQKGFSRVNERFDKVEVRLDKVEGRIDKVEGRIDKVEGILDKLEKGQVRLENELKDTKKTLYDGYIQNAEAIKRIELKVDEISEKVDRHDIKIQVIEGGRKAL